MYNIHSHYENILDFANTIVTQSSLIYLHPFGSTQPENIEALQNGGYGPLIIAYDQEPLIEHYNSYLFSYINDNFKDDSGRSRPIILLNTEKYSEAKDDILKKFNYTDVNYFFHIFAAADWYRGYQYSAALTAPAQRKITKKYITFNRITGNARSYRSFLVAELAKNNLLEHGHVSYSDICPVHGKYQESILYAVDQYKIDPNYANDVIKTLNTINFPLRIDSGKNIPNGSQTIGPVSELMESFLHVVTETCFWDRRTHLTEKIFKPIVARQPFVLLGCANNLQYLRSYGFKTFDSWWDESYDRIEDPVLRLQAVVKIIDEICNLSDADLEAMLRGMKYVLDYNYELFYSKEFIQKAWCELTDNLKAALVLQ
jgi:hypothetical protein